MKKTIELTLMPEQYFVEKRMYQAVARHLKLDDKDVKHVNVLRRSIDSRRSKVYYHVTAEVYTHSDVYKKEIIQVNYKDVNQAEPLIIVGAGPAGLFAALRALEVGLKPIILERGKNVKDRKYDIAKLTKEGIVNSDSNWCFGEGGAGTYSDGKLYTRSTKRGNITDVLNKFIEHGASEEITIDAHAHIGTDRLSGIIANIRETIENYGGEYHFSTRVVDLMVQDGKVTGVKTADGASYEGVAVVLATGHSARDVYELFYKKNWKIEAKPFAMGVRVEHPQELINSIQYHGENYSSYLPPATYSLVTQVENHGVFSFCMCPGGIIVPAATAEGQQVVNGMSNSRRNSPYANSGIAVTVNETDLPSEYSQHGPLSLLRFQQDVERSMFAAAGNTIKAPTQRLNDFCNGKHSKRLNKCSYIPGCVEAPLHELMPPFIVKSLQQGFRFFGSKMKGFYTESANVLAVESRTSSPVRIPRKEDYEHVQLENLYPCGEGAGYAGGIMSSAIDGINCVNAIARKANLTME
jgi:uncharacterized FAD-dependent dehydrogenase